MSDDAASLTMIAALFFGWPMWMIAARLTRISKALERLVALAERNRP